ncbi:MAG: glycoside hydrolase family 28 protein [Clostridia bacterium]|nr:glycoside hydrolase family 28 protein [Clostridia bacterium]
MECLYISSRSATVLLDREGDYYASSRVRLRLNGEDIGTEDRSVCSLFGLWPDTEYVLEGLAEGRPAESLVFRTAKEACTLNVRRFGALGDGEHDDTPMLQAAILSCPPGGRVLVPKGTYRTGPLFLKSDITIEIQKDAVLALRTDRDAFPILPGMTRTTDEQDEYLLGSWEGNPLSSFASALTGISVENVQIIGEGVVDGCAQQGDWWINHRTLRGAWRGRLFYLRDCANVTVQGITFRNSPAWNLHPTFSRQLSFLNVRVEAPPDSPNTDGFDPESCRGIRMLGTVFSVGDDCIAIKSGKIYMGQKYHTPCEDIEIAWCAMLDGHGGVTVGSEMAGGVRGVRVHNCYMRGNDRGLRIKTRRGRGQYAVVDDIVFEDVRMEGVKAPLVVNAMYFCDPDGRSAYVQSREKQPVDDTTPTVGSIRFERVQAKDCAACAAYILGLPELPAEKITIRDCAFSFAADAKPMVPAMAAGVEACSRRGVIARFVQQIVLEGVRTEGIAGDWLDVQDCGQIVDHNILNQ